MGHSKKWSGDDNSERILKRIIMWFREFKQVFPPAILATSEYCLGVYNIFPTFLEVNKSIRTILLKFGFELYFTCKNLEKE